VRARRACETARLMTNSLSIEIRQSDARLAHQYHYQLDAFETATGYVGGADSDVPPLAPDAHEGKAPLRRLVTPIGQAGVGPAEAPGPTGSPT
jgi:hypothetical protein